MLFGLLFQIPLLLGSQLAIRAQAADVDVIVTERRSFQIPVFLDDPKVKEYRLFVSRDRGKSWTEIAKGRSDQPAIPFTAPADGMYWFGIQTIRNTGDLVPAQVKDLQPLAKVEVKATLSREEQLIQGLRHEISRLQRDVLLLERRLTELEKRTPPK